MFLFTKILLLVGFLVATPSYASREEPDFLFEMPSTLPASDSASTEKTPDIVFIALSLTGIPYRFGGTTPEFGMDCSGMVRYVFKETSGTELPRSSEEISRLGEQIANAKLRPGDLVFFNTLKRAFSHVGIYLGERKFIHSPSSGGKIRIENLDTTYWKKRFDGARRLLFDAE